jgi:hypothetical protein
MLQRLTALPGSNSQRILLREATRPGTSYLFRLADVGKEGRSFMLRFRSDVEIEIVDPKTKTPFQAAMPVWKGQKDSEGGPHLYFGTEGNWDESGWAFSLGLDDQPMIYCPGAGNGRAPFPAREIPVFLMR